MIAICYLCNILTGMFQRVEKMRSQTFASVCVFGTDNNNSISGVWVWKGQGLAFEVTIRFLLFFCFFF